MADSYWRYSSGGAERSGVPRAVYPADSPTDLPSLGSQTSQPYYYSSNLHRSSIDRFSRDLPIPPFRAHLYGLDDTSDVRVQSESALNGLASGINVRDHSYNYSSAYEHPNLPSLRQDVSGGISTALLEPVSERPNSRRSSDSLSDAAKESSSMLFVDGLPCDCTRREVGHIFRPFIGFKDIRVVHKEPRRRGDKAMVLCFVEFENPSCARTAKEALQGYKFDDKKAESPALNIHFAYFPFKLPSTDHN